MWAFFQVICLSSAHPGSPFQISLALYMKTVHSWKKGWTLKSIFYIEERSGERFGCELYEYENLCNEILVNSIKAFLYSMREKYQHLSTTFTKRSCMAMTSLWTPSEFIHAVISYCSSTLMVYGVTLQRSLVLIVTRVSQEFSFETTNLIRIDTYARVWKSSNGYGTTTNTSNDRQRR